MIVGRGPPPPAGAGLEDGEHGEARGPCGGEGHDLAPTEVVAGQVDLEGHQAEGRGQGQRRRRGRQEHLGHRTHGREPAPSRGPDHAPAHGGHAPELRGPPEPPGPAHE